jgi:HAD superfamily hydrolase (TIGR01509 family)
MEIKVVCFDIGGVLVHVASIWGEAMRSAALEPSAKDGYKLDSFPAFDLFQAGQLSIEAYVDELAEFLSLPADKALRAHDHILMEPTEGTLDIIEQLNARGVGTACLSNTNSPHWAELMKPDRFPNIAALKLKAASQELGFAKPDSRIFGAFEELSGAVPSEILFFEDGPANVAGARACGWNVVQIDPKGSQQQQITTALEAVGLSVAPARR